MYTYYFNEETCMLYKHSGGAFAEEYIDFAKEWKVVDLQEIEGLPVISEEDADDLIKEFEGDEYDLIDGEIVCSIEGEE